MIKQPRTIKDARSDLRMWGFFWARQEEGSGYASVSVTERLRQMLDLGIWSSSDLHLYANMADSIHIPDHIDKVDAAIKKLPKPQQMDLAAKYIKRKMIDNYNVREGENALITLISW